ncbi:MAG: hypothetical protein E6713_11715 [Sporomusaceae bacterium]|nr:hypothetical protein [Sporomusaceae bacterium]
MNDRRRLLIIGKPGQGENEVIHYRNSGGVTEKDLEEVNRKRGWEKRWKT